MYEWSAEWLAGISGRCLNFSHWIHFYSSNVQLPTANTPVTSKILDDCCFQYFLDCVGAVNGTHIHVFVPAEEHVNMQYQKGAILQNCLFVCDFDLLFMYAVTGWDVSMADAPMWYNAHTDNLYIPRRKIPSCRCRIWGIRCTPSSIPWNMVPSKRVASNKSTVNLKNNLLAMCSPNVY